MRVPRHTGQDAIACALKAQTSTALAQFKPEAVWKVSSSTQSPSAGSGGQGNGVSAGTGSSTRISLLQGMSESTRGVSFPPPPPLFFWWRAHTCTCIIYLPAILPLPATFSRLPPQIARIQTIHAARLSIVHGGRSKQSPGFRLSVPQEHGVATATINGALTDTSQAERGCVYPSRPTSHYTPRCHHQLILMQCRAISRRRITPMAHDSLLNPHHIERRREQWACRCDKALGRSRSGRATCSQLSPWPHEPQ